MAHTHYFLAVPISKEITNLFYNWQQVAKNELTFKSWVHPEDYHITLAFLGNTPVSKLSELKKEMISVANNHRPFSIQLSDFGIFGRNEQPRIFWYGIEKNNMLTNLQKDVYQSCIKVSFDLEKRPYKPHLTLARKWHSDQSFPEHIGKITDTQLSFQVNEFVLYQTHLNRTPKYEKIAVFPLGK